MSEYLTDDEQLEHVKRLSREYGPPIVGAVAVGLLCVFGYRFYQEHRTQRALAADAEFAQMASALSAEDRSNARRVAESLIKEYPNSPYADQAKLVLARLAVDAGQDANAVAPLTDVMEHSKDTGLRRIARLRLARVEIDAGKPDEALKTLADDPGAAFAVDYHEVRGDAYAAQKDVARAVGEYKAALGAGPDGSPQSSIIVLKIADLGVSPVTPPVAAAALTPSAAMANKGKP
jgi:predicted negative regulator of RcsB-dependent stress response